MNQRQIARLLPNAQRSTFVTTHWSLVLNAAKGDSTTSRDALAELCAVYWYPLYAYVRRLGRSPEDSMDMVQGFFARVLKSEWLKSASPDRGKFRSWLLASLQHHLADERDHAKAKKRGSGDAPVSLDALDGESRYSLEPRESMTPEKLYDRRWALIVLDRVLNRLKKEHESEGKSSQFEVLQQTLPGGSGDRSYAEIAKHLNITEGGVKAAVHRLRERYRIILRDEIARTVVSPDQIDEEIHQLMDALAEP